MQSILEIAGVSMPKMEYRKKAAWMLHRRYNERRVSLQIRRDERFRWRKADHKWAEPALVCRLSLQWQSLFWAAIIKSQTSALVRRILELGSRMSMPFSSNTGLRLIFEEFETPLCVLLVARFFNLLNTLLLWRCEASSSDFLSRKTARAYFFGSRRHWRCFQSKTYF